MFALVQRNHGRPKGLKKSKRRLQFGLRFILLGCVVAAAPLAMFSGSDHHRRALLAIHNDDVNAVRLIAATHPDAIRANRYAGLLQTAYQGCSTEMIELLTSLYRLEDLHREASLQSAIRSNRIDKVKCVELILGRGIAPSIVFVDAIDERDPAALKLLLKRGAKVDGTIMEAASEALRVAIRERDPSCLVLLTKCGATIDKEVVLQAVYTGRYEIFQPIFVASQLAAKDTCCVLNAALEAYAGDDQLLDHLIRSGVSPSATCMHCQKQPLVVAWERRSMNHIAKLIRAGADPHETDLDLAKVLLGAARARHLEACRLLMRHGVDVNESWKLNARLYWSNMTTVDSAEVLLELDSDTNTIVHKGGTALNRLADVGGPWTSKHEEICLQMLRCGANVYIEDDRGRRPIDSDRITALWAIVQDEK